jgi:hypothetical protein
MPRGGLLASSQSRSRQKDTRLLQACGQPAAASGRLPPQRARARFSSSSAIASKPDDADDAPGWRKE